MTSWTPEGRNHEGVLVRYPLVDNDPHFSRVIGSLYVPLQLPRCSYTAHRPVAVLETTQSSALPPFSVLPSSTS